MRSAGAALGAPGLNAGALRKRARSRRWLAPLGRRRMLRGRHRERPQLAASDEFGRARERSEIDLDPSAQHR
jgi:hypothetical protein